MRAKAIFLGKTMADKQLTLFDNTAEPISEADKTWQEAWKELCEGDRRTLEQDNA